MRTIMILVALFGMASCTSMLVEGAGAPAGRPIGQDNRGAATVAEDDRITATIRGRYAADADLSAAGLSVQTQQGTVTLRGTVRDFGHRDRAVRLARDVAGVVRINNQITVRTR